MRIKSFIAGCAGISLTAAEERFFRAENPWGFILFARNIDTPDQVRALTDQFRAVTGRDNVPVLIDQEGGRVQRLRPPHWTDFPPAAVLGSIYARNPDAGKRAAWLQSRLIALELSALGINVNCLPVLDVPVPGSHDVIGNRAYSFHPFEVAQMARSACQGLLAGGVLPVIKHVPGHGRAASDSHLQLPVVSTHPAILGCTDFYPFMQLADMPIAMTAHVVYSTFDPEKPATTSFRMIDGIVRGWLGFDGLLLSDDLSMKALSGDFADRAKSAFAAGCDIVLHCNGDIKEMEAIAAVSPVLEGRAELRARLALDLIRQPEDADERELRDEFSALVGVPA